MKMFFIHENTRIVAGMRKVPVNCYSLTLQSFGDFQFLMKFLKPEKIALKYGTLFTLA